MLREKGTNSSPPYEKLLAAFSYIYYQSIFATFDHPCEKEAWTVY